MESNHLSPGCHPGVVAIGPRDHRVTRVGVEPTKSPGSRPGRFASLRTQSSMQSSGFGGRTRQSRLMRPVEHWLTRVSVSVAKGRFELPRHKWHDILSVAPTNATVGARLFHHLAMLFRVGRTGIEPPQSEDRWVTASLALQCTPTLEMTQAGFETGISHGAERGDQSH